MPGDLPDRPATERLYALRLRPAAQAPGVQGEIEHVMSGDRCRFREAAELLAWLQGRPEAGATKPLQTAPDVVGAPVPREATT